MQISVVIPTFNRAIKLVDAIDSVLSQTHKAHELVVVDDGSTDDTEELCNKKFSQVQYIKQSNKGVSSARNAGIKHSSGDWIAFLDSDDVWHSNKLMQQKIALETEPKFRICHTNEIWVRNGKRVNPMVKHTKKGGSIFRHCLPLCAISPSSVIIHRNVFEDVGVFDESLPACEDYDLWLRITAKYPVLYLPELLITKYGGHTDQLSRRYWGMDRFRVQALEKILQLSILNPEDTYFVLQHIVEKIRIVLTGAKKHDNQELIECYSMKLHSHEKHLQKFLG